MRRLISKGSVRLLVVALTGFVCLAQSTKNEAALQGHRQRARDALKEHDLQTASREYQEILKLDKQDAEAYTGLGVTLYGLGKAQPAAEALESALRLDPGQATAQMFLPLSKAASGQCGEAIPLLTKAYEGSAADPKLRRLEGLSLVTCYEDQGELDKARAVAQTLQGLYPDDPEVMFHLAEIYSSLLNTTVDTLLKKHPESYRFHQIAGETLEAEGNGKQAIKEYRRVLDLNPNALRIHYRIGKLLLSTEPKNEADEKALLEFRKELALNAHDAAALYQSGDVYLTNHRNAEAKQAFLSALQVSPNFAEARVGLAKIELQEHDPQGAIADLQKAITLQPRNQAAHYTLMLAYRGSGQPEKATQEMQVFQSLKSQQSQDFRSELRALLAGGGSEPER